MGVGAVITRSIDRTADTKWIYLGCLIPDFPWILQRIVRTGPVEFDPYDLRLYTLSLATLLGCVTLSAALAIISTAPLRIFMILAGNSALHLMLDACQTKWGRGGVHLIAPFDWTPANFGLFWPESITTAALTLFGLIYCLFDLRQRERQSIGLSLRSLSRNFASLALLLGYLAFPVLTMQSAFEADCHFVRTLVETDNRPGRLLELDRAWFRANPSGDHITTYGRENLRVDLATERSEGRVSIRGVFVDETQVRLLDCHEHWPILRQLASVVGIALVLLVWLWYLASETKRLGRVA
jgi:hypothetical protein